VTALWVGAAYFCWIFARAFQQRNIAHGHYLPILPMSYAIALLEVFVIANIAREGFGMEMVLALGTGGGLGASAAMLLHQRIYRNRGTDGF
jgi:hypothetical protein